MKQVSAEYKESMQGSLRNRSFVKISLSNVDASAASDGEWLSNGQQAYSEFATLDYDYCYDEAYATLELNRWALDGGTVILPENEEMRDGFVSLSMSDDDGEFPAPVIIHRAFSTPHAFPGLTLTFDTRYHEWPDSVQVDFALAGEVLVSQVVPVSSESVIVDAKVADCDEITVKFGNTLPHHRVRVEKVLFGIMKEFTNGDVISTRQSHDVDPLSRRLPKESLQFVLLDYERNYNSENPQGFWAYLDEKSPVNIQFGYELPDKSIEWLKGDNYLLDGKPKLSNNRATFSATGLLGSLNGTFYKSKLGEKSFYDMAEEVLLDAELTPTETGDNPWVIDDALKEMYTTAALPIDTHANCLQLIAHACRCRLFTDDDNIIHIKPFGVTATGIYSGAWADNGHLWYSEWDTVDNEKAADSTYATLELNRWTLDGGPQVVVSDTDPTGLGVIGDAMSEADGTYYEAPIFTKTFDVSHDLPVLAIQFDTVLEEYPNAIVVKYYRDDEIIDTQSIREIKSPDVYVTSQTATDCTGIEIAVQSGLPHRRVRITGVSYRETDFILDFNTISENSQAVSKIDKLKAVCVARYAYAANNSNQTLYEETTDEEQLHIEFASLAQDVQVSVYGGTLLSSEIYAQAADLELSGGTKTVVITGRAISENSVITTYPVAATGEVDKERNPLITNEAMCAALAEHVKKYLLMRNTYECSYRGNPEMEVGDVIGLQTPYTRQVDALILVDELNFNGSLSGKMKVKGLL